MRLLRPLPLRERSSGVDERGAKIFTMLLVSLEQTFFGSKLDLR